MASDSITITEPMAIIEADEDQAELTIPQNLSRVNLLNLGPDAVQLRTAAGNIVGDPAVPAQRDGEAILPSGQSFPLSTHLGSVKYKTTAAGSAFLSLAADFE